MEPITADLLEKAIATAIAAHQGARDKAGGPYILHPLYLMTQMETGEEMMVAVLHDVVEDSRFTLDDLAAMQFPPAVLEAVRLLTHEKEAASYDAYIDGLKENTLARRVKLADLEHNMDSRRLPHPLREEDMQRLRRYRRAWKLLTGR